MGVADGGVLEVSTVHAGSKLVCDANYRTHIADVRKNVMT